MKHLRPSQAAKILGAKTVTVRSWLTQGKFPNAFQEQTEFYIFPVWRIPEADVKNFEKPARGRPKKKITLQKL